MEEETTSVMEEIIYVAVGKETAKNKSNLTWVIDNYEGNKICIVLVHQPAQWIPVLGTKFDAATVDDELVRAYREKQKAKTEKILYEYLRFCLRKGVQAETLCVEMDSIGKGIVQMVCEKKVRKLVMGAAADKHYSMKLEDLRSKKALFVCKHAPATCHIQFVCKGHLIHTREARMDEVRALSALLSEFQRLVISQSSSCSDMFSGSSKGKQEKEEEEEEEERVSRTSSSRSAGTLSYFGGSEASSSITVLTEEQSLKTPSPPSLPCTGMGLGLINFLINSTKIWQKLAIQNHKQCE